MSTLRAPRRPEGCASDFLLDRLMARDLAGDPDADDVRAHLASCSRCRNRLAELEAVEAPLFEDVLAQSVERKPRHESTRWTLPAIALAAAAVLVVSARVKWNDEPSPGATRAKGVLGLDLVLRLPSGEITRPAPGGIVSPGDALRFEVTAARPGFVTVLGLDAAGTITVYAPTSESPIHLEGSSPTVLPGSIVADSTLGHERIVAVLCSESRPLDELKQAARRALSEAANDPQRVTELGTSCSEASFMIEKKARP